ncbi:hypothetical protein ACQJBY_025855 [Aegilops geniculata]
MYKLRLNNVCQERRWAPPAYTDRREGPDHASRFHSTVAVGGAEFSSPEPGSRKLIDAQDLAARAALEDLAARPALEHPSAPPQLLTEMHLPYKSQLRNYAQELRKDLPLYNTTQSGPHHEPIFKSTVTIDGWTFGSLQDYATKKEAESAAAAAALVAIRQEAKRSEQMLMQLQRLLLVPSAVAPRQLTRSRSTDAILEWCYQMGLPYSPLVMMSVWL